ncbi:ISAs1 family transposase [Emticicia sp.]|uniref:ISAs1 family transposase n=1 Tax=Emticicia sp. TaxID=1930953 RepID=UPI0037527CDC
MSKIKGYFEQVQEPRCKGKCLHLLSDILLIGLLTYLSNGEDYEDMVLFAESKGGLFPELLTFPNGIPSHDTFNRVFQLIDNQSLKECLTAHGREILDILSEKQIAIDGKKLKGVSPTSKGNHGLYIVNAWLSENRLCIGEEKIQEKSNEITAIPKVLKQIDLIDSVVSIDAMGCQTAIVEQIKQQGGHYFLSVKGNQKRLLEEIQGSFEGLLPFFNARRMGV